MKILAILLAYFFLSALLASFVGSFIRAGRGGGE
jgi:hypothetical protein